MFVYHDSHLSLNLLFIDVSINLPEKVNIHRGRKAEVNITLKVDKSLCLPKLKSITALLYDFSNMNENFLHLYISSLLLLKSCST